MWKDPEFKALEDEPEPHNGLGMHSSRKYATDKAKKLGAQTHEVEFRGRWAGDWADTVGGWHYICVEDQYTVYTYDSANDMLLNEIAPS